MASEKEIFSTPTSMQLHEYCLHHPSPRLSRPAGSPDETSVCRPQRARGTSSSRVNTPENSLSSPEKVLSEPVNTLPDAVSESIHSVPGGQHEPDDCLTRYPDRPTDRRVSNILSASAATAIRTAGILAVPKLLANPRSREPGIGVAMTANPASTCFRKRLSRKRKSRSKSGFSPLP